MAATSRTSDAADQWLNDNSASTFGPTEEYMDLDDHARVYIEGDPDPDNWDVVGYSMATPVDRALAANDNEVFVTRL